MSDIIHCLVCNKVQFTLIDGYRRCEKCRTYIAESLPNERRVQKVLEEHASSFIVGSQESKDIRTEEMRLSLIKKFSKVASIVIDCGCGKGKFVEFLSSKKYKVFGYDKSEVIKKYLVSKNIAFYESVKEIPTGYFDVATCFDVIEHVTNPRHLIWTIVRKLKKDGIFIISTPNSIGFSARILGKRWWVFSARSHFILFSPYSLKLLLADMGFEILDAKTDTITPWFTPSERFVFKIFNKLIYLIFLPFKSILFDNYLGDNIQIVAKLAGGKNAG